MVKLHDDDIRNFCNQCDWVLQMWQFRQYFFDTNPEVENLKDPRHKDFFNRIFTMSSEYWMLQVAKLNDPSGMYGSNNLSISYVIEYGDWTPEIEFKLNTLRKAMEPVAKSIKEARNKIISHNDLATQRREYTYLGGFSPEDGEIYFESLIQFAEIISQEALKRPFVYDDLVRNDVEAFMKCFDRGLNS